MKMRDVYYDKYCTEKLNYDVMYKWMNCDLHGKRIEDELWKKKIRCVAIYGAGDFGGILWRKLKDSKIQVDCFVDKYSQALHYGVEDISIIRPEQLGEREGIDIIIVTVLHLFEQIRQDLQMTGNRIPVVSLEDIIMKM